jgi:hypothetical protein
LIAQLQDKLKRLNPNSAEYRHEREILKDARQLLEEKIQKRQML